MSQIVTLKRKISPEELQQALDQIDTLALEVEHDWGCTIAYVPDPDLLVTFANGEVEATSPSDGLLQDLQALAVLLGAEVVLEDEFVTLDSVARSKAGWEIVLFWPILVFALLSLLVWRW